MVVMYLREAKANQTMSGDATALCLPSPLPWAAPKQHKPQSLKQAGLYPCQLPWGQIGNLTCPEEMPEAIQAVKKPMLTARFKVLERSRILPSNLNKPLSLLSSGIKCNANGSTRHHDEGASGRCLWNEEMVIITVHKQKNWFYCSEIFFPFIWGNVASAPNIMHQ